MRSRDDHEVATAAPGHGAGLLLEACSALQRQQLVVVYNTEPVVWPCVAVWKTRALA